MESKIIELLRNEIKMHRLLTSCPNIIKLHRVFESKKALFLVLDYMEGGSLFDFITDKRDILED